MATIVAFRDRVSYGRRVPVRLFHPRAERATITAITECISSATYELRRCLLYHIDVSILNVPRFFFPRPYDVRPGADPPRGVPATGYLLCRGALHEACPTVWIYHYCYIDNLSFVAFDIDRLKSTGGEGARPLDPDPVVVDRRSQVCTVYSQQYLREQPNKKSK